MPQAIGIEDAGRRRYPLSLAGDFGGLKVVYRRSRWERVGWDDSADVKRREIFAWLLDGGRRVGAVSFAEYDTRHWTDNRSFFDEMDDNSAEEGRLAYVLTTHWSEVNLDLFAYGSVLELRSVWHELRHPGRGLWPRVADALLAAQEPGSAIIITHLFPLEYEGLAPDNAKSRIGFERRLAAMSRSVDRLYGLRPFPGLAGLNGWCWRPTARLNGHLAEPSYNSRGCLG